MSKKASVDRTIGILTCVWSALLCSIIFFFFFGRNASINLPLCFIPILVTVAIHYGFEAALPGTLGAAIVFGVFLLKPIDGLGNGEGGGWENLGWMLVCGIALSYIFSPSDARVAKQRTHGSRDRFEERMK